MSEQAKRTLEKFAKVLPHLEEKELIKVEACADTLCLMREKGEENDNQVIEENCSGNADSLRPEA